MIKLRILDVCHDCPDFEPVADKVINRSAYGSAMAFTDVRCRDHDKCARILKYLKNKESSNEE